MLPVLFRIPDWIPGLGGQAITSFGTLLLIVPSAARSGDFVRVHPTQLYEAGLSLGVLAALERMRGSRNGFRVGRSRLFGVYLLLAGAARVSVELLRLKRDQTAGPITVDLLLALIAITVGVVLRSGRERKAHRSEVT